MPDQPTRPMSQSSPAVSGGARSPAAHTFFVMIKLVPIATLELIARTSPIHLSWLSVAISASV